MKMRMSALVQIQRFNEDYKTKITSSGRTSKKEKKKKSETLLRGGEKCISSKIRLTWKMKIQLSGEQEFTEGHLAEIIVWKMCTVLGVTI
jgi:hypothetical protein